MKGNYTYKGVSICEDLTPEQRKEFKELTIEARSKNATETDGIWRVRGSSKNGFRLKKVDQPPSLINTKQNNINNEKQETHIQKKTTNTNNNNQPSNQSKNISKDAKNKTVKTSR